MTDDGLDLNATIKAINTALADEPLTKEDYQVLYDLNQILIETLEQLTAREH